MARDTLEAPLNGFFSSSALAPHPRQRSLLAQPRGKALAMSSTGRSEARCNEGNLQMAQAKKAHCPAPGAVARACRNYWAATQPQSLAKAGAALISEGIAILSEARRDAPKLIEACRTRYLRFGAAISTHIPASVREQARHLKRERGLASLQDLYLEAILGSLINRGFLSRKLDLVGTPERG